MAGDVVRNYKIRYSAEDKATGPINSLGAALVTGTARVNTFKASLKPATDAIGTLGSAAAYAEQEVKQLNEALRGLPKGAGNQAANILGGFGRIEFNAQSATKSVQGFNAAMGAVGSQVAGVNNLQSAIQKTQRSTLRAAQERSGN